MQRGTDLLEGSLEDLRTLISTRLKAAPKPAPPSVSGTATPGMSSVCFIYDQRDEAAVAPWADLFFKEFEVVHPLFEGDEKELRESHEESLRTCDGVLVFSGAANEAWLRRKLTEIQKSPGLRPDQGAPRGVHLPHSAADAGQGEVSNPSRAGDSPVERL